MGVRCNRRCDQIRFYIFHGLIGVRREIVKTRDSFSGYHPIVNLMYFICTIGYALAFTHPVCLGMSFIGAFVYSIILRGENGFKANIKYMIPLIVLTAVINPLFSHQGVTVLAYLPTGNQLTLESVLYGIMAAFMLVTVLCWFSCFNRVITSDKMVYLFGKAAPVLSLILSMTLRFIPDITSQFGKVYRAQKASGYKANGSHFVRLKTGCHVFSAVVTWSLEKALVTADSMKSRGYGLPGRTAYSLFRFKKSDVRALAFIFICGLYIIIGNSRGGFRFFYYPAVRGQMTGWLTVSMYIVYACLICLPIYMNVRDHIRFEKA